MREYLSPGVYVEEVDAGPKPIEGVSTSTAGAVGVTARGPDTGKPVLITSFADYLRVFGGPVTADATVKARWTNDPERGEFWTFPLAIRGFFDNGGQWIYVRRVTARGALPSATTLGRGILAYITRDALPSSTTLQLESLIGIEQGTALTISIEGNTVTRVVNSYDAAAREVTLAAALPPVRVVRGRDFVSCRVAAAASVGIVADSAGAWGDAVAVRIQPMDAGSFALLFDPSIPNPSDTTAIAAAVVVDDKFTVTSGANIANGDYVLVDGTQYKVTSIQPANTLTVALPAINGAWTAGAAVVLGTNPGGATSTAIAAAANGDSFDVTDATNFAAGPILVAGTPYLLDTITLTAAPAATFKLKPARAWSQGAAVVRVRFAAAPLTTAPVLYVWGASSLYPNAIVELENPVTQRKHYGSVTKIDGNKVTLGFAAAPGFALFEGQRLRLIEARASVRYAPPTGPETEEVIENLHLAESEAGDPLFIGRRIEAVSNLVKVAAVPAVSITSLDDFPLALAAPPANLVAMPWAKLTAGTDDFGSLDADAFVGADLGPNRRTGIQALEDIDDISICVVPGIWSSLVQNALIQHCELLKYRFAILDPRPVDRNSVDAIGDIRAFREGFDSKYAALYFPRIAVRDPYASATVGVGPSGHMAGLYARVDTERGVHKAPGNEVIRGIDTANGFHGLEDEITKREQDLLNPRGINALRFFPNRGTRVWGARTLSSDPSWKYINVRRIFIWVERSIDVGTQWVVFEPNEERTWARVRQTITNFLTTVWRTGALFGAKADEAFFVRCDRTTMTQDDIDNGRLICVIGICPVKPAEFVIFRIQQKLIDQKQS